MIDKRAELAQELAENAGNSLIEYFYHHHLDVEVKDDNTLITKADLIANEIITDGIKSKFPGDGILSEEEITTFPTQKNVWVIDPLDGTTNFSKGLHHWGVSIACLIDGFPALAIVHFPIIKETFTAQANHGAFLNNQPLDIEPIKHEQQYTFFVHCSRMYQQYQTTIPYKTRSLGSAAYHLCLIAKGSALLAFESRTKLWDLAGSWLIIKESGGAVQTYHQESLFPAQEGIDYNAHYSPVIAGANRDLIEYARDNIHKI